MENKPRVVTLYPAANSGEIQVATFEEAFGEHSNLFEGMRRRSAARRKRRQARRLERIRNRMERRKARHQGRQELKDYDAQEEQAREASANQDQGGSQDSGSGSSDSGSASQDSGSSSQDSGSADQSMSDDSGASQDDGGASQDDGSGDDQSGFDSNGRGYFDTDDDAKREMADDESDFSHFDQERADNGRIHPEVADLTNRIRWNEEKLRRLTAKALDIQRRIDQNPDKPGKLINLARQLERKIKETRSRLAGLHMPLKSYKQTHPAHVRAGLRKAGHELERNKIEGRDGRVERRQPGVRKSGGGLTAVEKGLRPEMGPNRIEVPGRSSFDAKPGVGNDLGIPRQTGLIGLDANDDMSDSLTRKIVVKQTVDETKSGFDDLPDGETMSAFSGHLETKHIVIGVALAGAAIWAIHRFKLFAK